MQHFLVKINCYFSGISMITKQEERRRWVLWLTDWLIGGYLQIGHLMKVLVRFRALGCIGLSFWCCNG